MSNEKTLGISGIAIKPERLRSLKPEKVTELAESMAKLGQLQSIIVRPVGKTGSGNGYWLIAGRHRLEAAKQLKWPAILATVLENVKADTAELIEIDENLIRAELSPAERADHVGRRKALYEKLHPETKHGAAPGKAGGGKKAKGTKLGSFAKATAKATGQSATKIKRDATRAKDLDKLLGRINGTSLDKGAEMDALRKLPEEEQEILVARAAAGEQVSAREALAAKKSGAKSEPAPVEEQEVEPAAESEEKISAGDALKAIQEVDALKTAPADFIQRVGAEVAEAFAKAVLHELGVDAPEEQESDEPFFQLVLKPGDALRWDEFAPAKEDGGRQRAHATPIPNELDYLIAPQWNDDGEAIGYVVERRTYKKHGDFKTCRVIASGDISYDECKAAAQRDFNEIEFRLEGGAVEADSGAMINKPPRSVVSLRRAADLRTTAHHEAGHAVAAITLGIEFLKVDIIEGPSWRGRIQYDMTFGSSAHTAWVRLQEGRHQDPAVIDLAERLLITSFAGAVAQRRFAPNSYWAEDGGKDLQVSDLYLQRLLAGPPDSDAESKLAPFDDFYDDESGDYYGDSAFPDQDDIKFWYPPERIVDEQTLKAQHAKFDARAKALVREHWPAIQRVARALLEKKVLRQAEVKRLIARRHSRKNPK